MKGTADLLLAGLAACLLAIPLAAQEDGPSEQEEAEAALPGSASEARDPLVLPRWSEEDLRQFEAGRPVNLGGGLWPEELHPLEPVPAPFRTPPAPQALAAEMAGPPAPQPLAPELVAAYFGTPEPGEVTDPQNLLTPQRRRELERFLSHQAREARYDLHLLLLPGEHDATARLPELRDRWFGRDSEAVLLAYRQGQPGSAAVAFPPEVLEKIPRQALQHVVNGAALRAGVATTTAGELDEFLLQLTIGLFDLERAAGLAPEPGPVAHRFHWEWAAVGKALLLTGAAAVVAFLGLLLWRRRQALAPPYYLPDREVFPRLEAPHSGGTSVVLRWQA